MCRSGGEEGRGEGNRRRPDKTKRRKKKETGMKGEPELFGARVSGRGGRGDQGQRRRQDETEREKEETRRREGNVWRECDSEVRMNASG